MKVLVPGADEGLKLAVHGSLLLLATLCCLYNGAARLQRGRGRHLVWNALLYGALAVFETKQVKRHWTRMI